MNWKKLLGLAPEVSVAPKPVTLNPTTADRAERNRQRIIRLRTAIAAGDTRPELRTELERREREGR